MNTSILPRSDDSYDLGSVDYRWKDIHFSGTLFGGVADSGVLKKVQAYYETDPLMPVTNNVHVTQENATIAEIALPYSPYAENKLQFVMPYSVEYTTDGTNWYDAPYTEEQLKKLVQGRYDGSGINIYPNDGWQALRFTFEAPTYVFLNWLYLFVATRYHKLKVKIEKSGPNETTPTNWEVVVPETDEIYKWPGHVLIPHNYIPWSPSPTTSRRKYVRITLYPIYNTDHMDTPITIYNINWYGTYPASRQDKTWYWDYNNDMYIVNNLLPKTDGYSNLGSSSNRWKDGYFSGTVYASTLRLSALQNTDGQTVLEFG